MKFDFIRRAFNDIRLCMSAEDRIALGCARAFRPLTASINYVSNLVLRKAVINPHWFLLREIRINTPYGVFCCRKQTSDWSACTPDHETEHARYFRLESGTYVDVGAHIGKW